MIVITRAAHNNGNYVWSFQIGTRLNVHLLIEECGFIVPYSQPLTL